MIEFTPTTLGIRSKVFLLSTMKTLFLFSFAALLGICFATLSYLRDLAKITTLFSVWIIGLIVTIVEFGVWWGTTHVVCLL